MMIDPLPINPADGTPIPRQLKERMAEKIRSGAWPAEFRLPSERELAELCGVSRMTARQAYNELLADGLIHRRVGRGSFVAPQPSRAVDSAPTLALVYSCHPENIEHLSCFHQAAAKEGYNTLFFDIGEDRQDPDREAEVLEKCRQARVHGIALFPTPLRDQTALYASLRREGIPLVLLIPHPFTVEAESWVWTDYRQAGEMGVRKLLDRGYQRVVYLGPNTPENRAHKLFFDGYCEALAAGGRQFTPEQEINIDPIFENPALPESELCRVLAAGLSPGTAFLGPSMRRASCVYHALLRLGLAIPRDYLVVGFGDPLPTLPDLPRIDPRTDKVMRAAVGILTGPLTPDRIIQREIAPAWRA